MFPVEICVQLVTYFVGEIGNFVVFPIVVEHVCIALPVVESGNGIHSRRCRCAGFRFPRFLVGLKRNEHLLTGRPNFKTFTNGIETCFIEIQLPGLLVN